MIGVVGDYNPENKTHVATSRALGELPAGIPFEWVPTSSLADEYADMLRRYSGLLIAPGSPYRSMEGALRAIRWARERGVPLVGT